MFPAGQAVAEARIRQHDEERAKLERKPAMAGGGGQTGGGGKRRADSRGALRRMQKAQGKAIGQRNMYRGCWRVPGPSSKPFLLLLFVPGLPHAMLVELRQAPCFVPG